MSGFSRSNEEKNLGMYKSLIESIQAFGTMNITHERKTVLQPLVDFIRFKKSNGTAIRLNFICTHNSRRSHLAQVKEY
jgi:arsenate reductase (thioredoxin)